MGKPFRVPKKVHKAQAPAPVTVPSSTTEEELQFISFLNNSSEDLSKYSRAHIAELVASTGLRLSAGAAIPCGVERARNNCSSSTHMLFKLPLLSMSC
jgi:hypothetical protein